MTPQNDGSRFDRVPPTSADRTVATRPTRMEIRDYFEDRFGIDRSVFDGCGFWEKGSGKIWVCSADVTTPIRIEALGIHLLRTGQRHWKPTTDGMQRFGVHADRNVVSLSHEQSVRFWRGDTQPMNWTGSAGYVVATHDLAGVETPLGVGLMRRGQLRSMVPKSRQRDLA